MVLWILGGTKAWNLWEYFGILKSSIANTMVYLYACILLLYAVHPILLTAQCLQSEMTLGTVTDNLTSHPTHEYNMYNSISDFVKCCHL